MNEPEVGDGSNGMLDARSLNATLARVELKTQTFAAVVVLSSVLGNFSLAVGLRRIGQLVLLSPAAYVKALFNPWVALGVSLLILWLLSHMALVSWADLSYVLPVTSSGYALSALAGRVFLHEHISLARWVGILLIVVGVGLVARTSSHAEEASL